MQILFIFSEICYIRLKCYSEIETRKIESYKYPIFFVYFKCKPLSIAQKLVFRMNTFDFILNTVYAS